MMRVHGKDLQQFIDTLSTWENHTELAAKFADNINEKLSQRKGHGSPTLVKAVKALHGPYIAGYVAFLQRGIQDPTPEDLRSLLHKVTPSAYATTVQRHRDLIVNHYYYQCSKVYRDILFPKTTHA